MGVAVEELRISEDVSGVDRAARAVESLGQQIASVGVAGARVQGAMTFGTLQEGVSKATAELRQLEAAFRGINKSEVVDIDVGRSLQAKISAKKSELTAMRAEAGRLAASDGFDLAAEQRKVQAVRDAAADAAKRERLDAARVDETYRRQIAAMHEAEAAQKKLAAAHRAYEQELKAQHADDALKRERLEAAKLEQAYERQLATLKQIHAEQRGGGGAGGGGGGPNWAQFGDGGAGDMLAGTGLDGIIGRASELLANPIAIGVAAMAAYANLIRQIVSAVASLTVKGAELAITSSEFRENTQKSFEFLLNDAKAARELYEEAMDVADKVGLEKEAVVGKLKALLVSGFDKDDALRAVEAAGNLAQVRDEATAQRLLELFTKTKAKGVFTDESLQALAELGVRRADVLAELAKATGKSVQTIEQELKAKQIDAMEGIRAIENVINNRFPEAGDKAGKTFARVLGDVKGNFERLFDDVDLGPVKEFLGNLVDAMKGPAGKELKGSISEFFGALFHTIFGPFKGEEGKQRLEHLLKQVTNMLKMMTDVVTKLAPLFELLARLIGQTNAEADGDSGRPFGKWDGIATMFTSIAGAAERMRNAIAFDMGPLDKLGGLATAANDNGKNLGNSMIAGMVAAITSGASSVASAMSGVVASAGSVNVPFGGGAVPGAGGAVGGASPVASDVVGSARGNATTNHVVINQAPAVVNVPPGATPEDARKLGTAASQATHAEDERHLIVTLQRLRLTS